MSTKKSSGFSITGVKPVSTRRSAQLNAGSKPRTEVQSAKGTRPGDKDPYYSTEA